MQSEWDIIKNISRRAGKGLSPDKKIYGIGDDCAVYTISENRYGLFSTDISIESVHFDLAYTSYHDAGYRSMSANISDIYAMGGKPVLTLIALGVPRNTTQSDIDNLYEGLISCASKNDTFIAGGDISSSEKLVVSISIYGETANPVYRYGAKSGDYIYVTGKPGLSQLGLELLQNGKDCSEYPSAKAKHLTPDPQKKLLDTILGHFNPAAMIDISDGLISDLGHICEESNTGFLIETDSVPLNDELLKFCSGNINKVLDYSLYSGEEYELLFTSSKLETGYADICCIGRITDSGYMLRSGNSIKNIKISGYDHFKR